MTSVTDRETHEGATDLDPEQGECRVQEIAEQSLAQFISQYYKSIVEAVTLHYPPGYRPSEDRTPRPTLLREPMGDQGLVIRAAAHSLKEHRGTFIFGEMGTGKTSCSIAAARMAGMKRVLVCCPPHLVRKWKREVEQTLPETDASAVIVRSTQDLRDVEAEWRGRRDGRTLFVIMSNSSSHLSHGWRHAYEARPAYAKGRMQRGEAWYHTGRGGPKSSETWRQAQGECEAGELDGPEGSNGATEPVEERGEQAGEPLEQDTVGPPSPPDRSGTYTHDGVDKLQGVRQREFLSPHCTACGQVVRDEEGVPLTVGEMERKHRRMICEAPDPDGDGEELCGSQLWTAQRTKGRRADGTQFEHRAKMALSQYVKKRMRRFFDLFIGDEIHEFKAKDSGRGIAAGSMADSCGRSLALTGTVMGGYASTLFYVLYRFSPEFRAAFGHNEQARWVRQYGFYERIIYREEERTEDGAASMRRRTKSPSWNEKPGLMPGALFYMIPNTAFVRLSDIAADLQPYEERLGIIDMDPDQEMNYQELYSALREALLNALQQGDQRLLGIYLQVLLTYPDRCHEGELVEHPVTGEVIADVKPMEADRIYPKEKELVRLVKAERDEGRRCLIYISHTDRRDMTARAKQVLGEAGVKAQVMLSSSAGGKAENREEWIAKRVGEGLDALICNPGLVRTGLDLLDFPTIIWYDIDYSVYTVRQASRRSWRPGQTLPVRVYYMVYEKTMQSRALDLIARKTRSSLAVEGELPEDGLVSYNEGEESMVISLARQIAGEVGSGDLRASFGAQAKNDEENERKLVEGDYLLDETWTLPRELDRGSQEPSPEEAADVRPTPREPRETRWRGFDLSKLSPVGEQLPLFTM